MTYAELIQAMQDWVESSETALVTNLDQMIEFAEKRIYRSVDLDIAKKGNNIIAITQGARTVALPSDLVVLTNVFLVNSGGTSYTALLQKDREFLRDFAPDESVQGVPRYYAHTVYPNIRLAPTPDATTAAGTLSIDYTYRPTQLSATETTTWLSLNAPDVLLYACLLELATFMKEEPDIIANYTNMYQTAFQGLLLEENFRNRQDEYRDGEIKVNL